MESRPVKKHVLHIIFFIGFFALICYSAAVSLAGTTPDNASFFAARRQVLMERMGEGIAVFIPEEMDKDFYYLTGFDRMPAACLLLPEEKKYVLFLQPGNPAQLIWTGKRFSLDEAKRLFGADEAYPMSQLQTVFNRYARGKERLYYGFNNEDFNSQVIRLLRRGREGMPVEVRSPLSWIHAMRVVKDGLERGHLRRAVDITCEALREVMAAAKPGMFEYELEALLEYVYQKNAARPGFPSIVGSGPNATILHYEENSRKTEDGDLVLMDVGAEAGHYTADVTRTFPVNGKFSSLQRDLYDIVLEANVKAAESVRPGRGLYEIHMTGVEVIKEGLFRLGLITDLENDWQYRVWLMYNTNHWIGLDVHDVGGRGPNDGVGMLLEPGMVFTIEPGIYINPTSLDGIQRKLGRSAPKDKKELEAFVEAVTPAFQKYLNIGVRIEDDVLVTETGGEVLSRKVPKAAEAIEALMGRK
jgi:Xaa-Pro aminopeptidase